MNRNIIKIVIIYALLNLISCTSYYPKFNEPAKKEKNEIEVYEKPYYEEKINTLGWSLNLTLSMGTGLAVYKYAPIDETKSYLAERDLKLSDENIKILQGSLAGLFTFIVNYYIMSEDLQKLTITGNEDAKQWLKDFDNKLLFIEFKNQKIKSLPNFADKNFIIYDYNDAYIFKSAFPQSPYLSSVLINSIGNFSNNELKGLIDILPNSYGSDSIRKKIILESKNINEWIDNVKLFPNTLQNINKSSIEDRIYKLVMNMDDAEKLIKTKPRYIDVSFIEDITFRIINSIDDIKKFRSLFPQTNRQEQLENKSLMFVKRYRDIQTLREIFPNFIQISKLQYAATQYINSLKDIEDYLKDFPNSPQKETLKEKAIKISKERSDIIYYSKLFPNDMNIYQLVSKYWNNLTRKEKLNVVQILPTSPQRDEYLNSFTNSIQDLDEAIASANILEDWIEDIAAVAAKYCNTPKNYRKYLYHFGETEASVEVRARYYQLIAEKPENLGKNINSEKSEFGPKISPDGETLFFVRRNESEDIYYSKIDEYGEWGPSIYMPYPLNNYNHNGVNAVSQDGSWILLHNRYQTKGNGMSYSYITVEGWSDPLDLEIPNYYTNSSYHNATMSPDGKVIIFSAARNDSKGGNDLYFTKRDKYSTWSKPKSLGNNINTKYEESSVFLAADGVTLYFSSDGHSGYGGDDIFLTKRLDNTWTKWSKPVNLGNKINSINDEKFYCVDPSGDYVYYSSDNMSYGELDIFRIGLPPDMRPNAIVLVKGKVIDKKTNEPIDAEVYYEDLDTGEELGKVQTNPNDGTYKIILPSGKRYGFRAEAEGYIPINQNVNLKNLQHYKQEISDLLLVPIESGQVATINNIFFDTGKSTLKKESFLELDRIANYFKHNNDISIEIGGHTDDVGDDITNQKLSENRAKAVADYLTKKGIPSKRIVIKGYGETKPIVPNNSDFNRSQNRRVEIKII